MKLDTSDADRFYRALGKAFKTWRDVYGKTVEEIAKTINVSPDQYERKESGETCSVRDFVAIINAIGVNPDAILENDEELEVRKTTPETPHHQGTEYLLPPVPRPSFSMGVPNITPNQWNANWNIGSAIQGQFVNSSYTQDEIQKAAQSLPSSTVPTSPRVLTFQEEQILTALHDKNSEALRNLALAWEVESWEAQDHAENDE